MGRGWGWSWGFRGFGAVTYPAGRGGDWVMVGEAGVVVRTSRWVMSELCISMILTYSCWEREKNSTNMGKTSLRGCVGDTVTMGNAYM